MRNIGALNAIDSALNKLPNRQEFEDVKSVLRTQANESLKPSQEELEKLKEVIKRGENAGMYG